MISTFVGIYNYTIILKASFCNIKSFKKCLEKSFQLKLKKINFQYKFQSPHHFHSKSDGDWRHKQHLVQHL